MLVKFTDILLTQARDLLSNAEYVRKSDTVPIAKAPGINFEAIFSTNENIETRILNWLGKEVIEGQQILFAKQPEKESDLSSAAGNKDIIPVNVMARISPQFLYYYLYLKKNQIFVVNKSGKHISKEKLTRLILPIPNLTVQKNTILGLKKHVENAEALIKNIQKEINNLKKEHIQVLSKVFKNINRFLTKGKLHSDAKIVRIGDAGIVQAGKTPNGSIKSYFGNEYPFYNQTAFDQGINIQVASKHLSERGMQEARLFKENSVLICFIGAQFGRAGIARNRGACNSQILSITPAENVLPEYLYYQIIADGFQSQMRQHSTNLSISKTDFENLLIEVPPIKKQEEIIDFLKEHQDYFDKKFNELSVKLNKTESKQLEAFSNLLSEKNIKFLQPG